MKTYTQIVKYTYLKNQAYMHKQIHTHMKRPREKRLKSIFCQNLSNDMRSIVNCIQMTLSPI